MLHIYLFIIETLKLLAPIVRQTAEHDPDLARQLKRAGSSIALNTAEAIGCRGGNVRARFRSALGSNQEVRACLDVAEAWSYVDAIDPAMRDRFDRIGRRARSTPALPPAVGRRDSLQAGYVTML